MMVLEASLSVGLSFLLILSSGNNLTACCFGPFGM
jgi:hypothetical protein